MSCRKVGVFLIGAVCMLPALCSTGCSVYQNGMTLPNPYYHKNLPQYFPRGTEFPFPREAASLQESEKDINRVQGLGETH
ncbi:MAG: hypothetical protein LBH00_09025 [Planctomycetaceae bacterium]|nr:hypothetical protein [Planctomycetaceae bacterium]